MNFKEFFMNESNKEIESLYPIKLIGKGAVAKVYDTKNPNIVIRVEYLKKSKELQDVSDNSCEKIMEKPEIQSSGGVAKIYKSIIKKYDFNHQENPVYITYKEKVNTDWLDYFSKKYGSKEADNIQKEIDNIFQDKNKIIKTLKKYPEADGLLRAIELKLPMEDLHSGNLGINAQNKLVAIDC